MPQSRTRDRKAMGEENMSKPQINDENSIVDEGLVTRSANDSPAPRGLGFEMPEEVWSIRNPEGLCAVARESSDWFVMVFGSEADAFAALLTEIQGAGNILVSGDPKACRPTRGIGQPKRPAVGAILFDRNWNELGRRYWA